MEVAMIARARRAKSLWLALVVGSFAIQGPVCAEMVRIYVTNSAGDSVHVVDPETNKVVQVFKGPEAMHGIAFAPDGSRVYVSNEHDRTLDVFSREGGQLIKQVKLSDRPNNIAVAKDGRVVIGIARGSGALDIVDPKTLELRANIPVNGRLHNVYVTRDSKYVVTGSIPNKVITVIDLDKKQVAWEVKLDKGIRPMAIESNADGSPRRIFAQLSDLNGFAVVDFAARKEIARITLPKAQATFETDPGRDTSPSHGIGISPDGKMLWVTSIPNNSVFVYSLADLKQIGEVALPALKIPGREQISSVPNWVTFTPDGKTIYISNAGMRSVTAIDTASMTVKAVIPVGEVPKRINTLVMN
jgi:YVTN family beta-propeller protein